MKNQKHLILSLILLSQCGLFGCALGLDPSIQSLEEGQELFSSFAAQEESAFNLSSTGSPRSAISEVNTDVLQAINNPVDAQILSLSQRNLHNKESLSTTEIAGIRDVVAGIEGEIKRLNELKNDLDSSSEGYDFVLSKIDEKIELMNAYSEAFLGVIDAHETSLLEGAEVTLQTTAMVAPLLPALGVGGPVGLAIGAAALVGLYAIDWFTS